MRDYDELVKRLKESDDNCHAECYECPGECLSSGCNIFSEAADAIEELVAAVPKWISVEEPPDNGRNIFICHGSADFKAPCIGHYEPNMKRFYEDKNWFASPIYDAMYWCEMPELPLPEPPEGVE